MSHYSVDELLEGKKAMDSLIKKCEKAQMSIKEGSSQWTTLCRRLKAFRMAAAIIDEALAKNAPKNEKTRTNSSAIACETEE